MIQKQKRKSSAYVSCIKINGAPILPPLITHHDVEELQKYKQKALEIERRLTTTNKNKLVVEYEISNNQLQKTTKSTTLEHQLAFNDDCDERNKDLPVSNIKNVDTVPYKDQNNLNLTCNIVDISEYSDDGVKLFEDSTACPSNCETEHNIDSVTTDTTAFNADCNNSDVEVSTLQDFHVTPSDESNESKPRLIRSNSYTLESPSPILLAHLEKQRSEEAEKYDFKYSRNWCSLDNNKLAQTFGDSSVNAATEKPDLCTVANESGDGDKDIQFVLEKDRSLDLHSDFLCSQTNTTPVNIENEVINKHSHLADENKAIIPAKIQDGSKSYAPEKFSDVEKQLLDVLNNVPEKYTVQILNLLEKKIQNEIQSSTFMEIRKILSHPSEQEDVSVKVQSQTTAVTASPEEYLQNENKIKSSDYSVVPTTPHSDTVNSFTSSQTIYYTINSSNETLNATSTPLGKFTDVDNESDINDNKDFGKLSVISNKIETNPKSGDKILSSRNVCKKLITESVNCTVRNILNCSKELFPEQDTWMQHRLKQEWAASVIGAHVKGYLVRRIMATDKVRGLIQTIKDALICAMELHSESTENINASDVELHRRLIQQVSAACYAFHDIFFTLTIPEQMAIIAHDRLWQQEKLKRPSSVKSARTPTSRKVALDRKRPGSARLYRNKVSF